MEFPSAEYEVSYAQVAGAGDKESSATEGSSGGGLGTSDSELCPTYLMSGRCQLGEHCSYIHGLMCEVCQLACLHPYDKEQRRIHKEVSFFILFGNLTVLHHGKLSLNLASGIRSTRV